MTVEITYFKTYNAKPVAISLEKVLDDIKTGTFKMQIMQIRLLQNKPEAKNKLNQLRKYIDIVDWLTPIQSN